MLAGDPLPAGQYFGVVDVRDVADAHVRAMTTEAAAGERFLVVADEPAVTFGELARMVGVSTDDNTTGTRPQISNAKAKQILGWRPRPLDETIRDTVTSLRDLGLA